jgi:FAD/FMN-containing dehydrogenase
MAQIDSTQIAGRVVNPGDDAWDEARSAWNLAVDQRPAAVVYPENADDVAAAVASARASGLRVAAQGTGHGAAARAALKDTVLLRMDRMVGVRIEPEARIGSFEAGVIWLDASNAAGEHGLATLSGSAPDVGVVGYTTGGGFGWLARRYGLACNSVRAMEVVTADGRLRHVDANSEPTPPTSGPGRSSRAGGSGPGTCPRRSPRSPGSSISRRCRWSPSPCGTGRC